MKIILAKAAYVLSLIFIAAPVWAACNAPATYEVGEGKTYATISGALTAVKAACGTAVNFGGAQTVSVYNGTYGSTTSGYTTGLKPTDANRLIIQAAPGQSPVINCGGVGDGILVDAAYTTFSGFEVTNCAFGVRAYRVGPIISNNYFHDLTGYCTISTETQAKNAEIHHNRIHNVPRGIGYQASSHVHHNEVSLTTATTNNYLISSAIAGQAQSLIHDNLLYAGHRTYASALWTYGPDLIYDNIAYGNRYGFQSGTTVAPGPVFERNISVNNYFNCHVETGSNPSWVSFLNNLCYYTTPGNGLGVMTLGGSAEPGLSTTRNNILWATSANLLDKNVTVNRNFSVAELDYNLYWKTGVINTAIGSTDINGGFVVPTLAQWQLLSPFDQHTIEANPRFMGSENLLVTTEQICPAPECNTIEERLSFIRRNYIPTNLAIKGKAKEGGDPGPQAVTVFNTPGANMSDSVADTFSGGVAF